MEHASAIAPPSNAITSVLGSGTACPGAESDGLAVKLAESSLKPSFSAKCRRSGSRLTQCAVEYHGGQQASAVDERLFLTTTPALNMLLKRENLLLEGYRSWRSGTRLH